VPQKGRTDASAKRAAVQLPLSGVVNEWLGGGAKCKWARSEGPSSYRISISISVLNLRLRIRMMSPESAGASLEE
jgi:hypothetical protein